MGYYTGLKKNYQQLIGRHAAPFIRDVMARFRKELISAPDAQAELSLSRSRFYVLYGDYLKACAQRKQRSWAPGGSGGNHHPAWSAEVCQLLTKLLQARPPTSYAFAADEVHRRHQLKIDRASVWRWALSRGLGPDTGYKQPRKPVRRWQVQQIGQLWQYDASPHRWFGPDHQPAHLLEIIDDHSRFVPDARIYERESLLAHLHFLSGAFRTCGLPLALYVDYHSIFFTNTPDAFTQLGAALRFYEVSLRFAPTPQAKGKIERLHDYWQKRLPAVFAAEAITTLPEANTLIAQLLDHRNEHEKHREIASTPSTAWKLALREKRSALRPVPSCPWWPYVWSQRSNARVEPDGRGALAGLRLRIDAPPGSKVIRCLHPNGDFSVLAAPPSHKARPIVLLHSPASKPVLL